MTDRAEWEGEPFRLLVDHVVDFPVFALDTEGRVRSWSRGAEGLLGYAREEVLGQPGDRFYTPEDVRDGVPERERRQALATGRGEDDRWHVRKDGSRFWSGGVLTPLRDEAGTLQGFAKIMSDRTDWWHAEQARLQSEARTAAVLEAALDAIVTIDQGGNVVEFNPAAERMFGYARSAVLGRDMASLIIPPRLREAHRRGLAHYLATGEGPVLNRRVEIEAVRADGTEFPVELAITRVPVGGPPHFTAYLRDITERQARERRRATQLALTQALAEAPTVRDAAPRVVRAICENLGWEMGAFWLVDRGDDLLRCVGTWRTPGAPAGGFEESSRGRTFARGAGLPGRVWGTGQPAWVADVAGDDNFPRLAAAAADGLHGAFAFPVTIGDGFLGVIEFISARVRDPDPDLLGMMAALGGQVGHFIERKQAEEGLRRAHAELEERVAGRTAELSRANEFLRALLESIQDGIVACDAGGVLTLFNRATQEFHGLPTEPLHADRWAEHYDLYQADGATRMTREDVPLFRALRGGRVQGVEMVIAPKCGPQRAMLCSGQAFQDEQGRTLGAVVSMHDITARKEAEAALRTAHEELERRVEGRTADLARANDALREADRRKGELLASLRDSEERFRTMAESIPQLAWMARPDGHIYWYNKRWQEYTGTTPEEMEGWGWQKVHNPEVLPTVMERWKGSIASGEPFDMVFPLRGADGRFRPFLTRVMPVRAEGGMVAHWFGTNTDISDRLRIEEELRAAKDQAEEANRAKTQFLAVLSHELRTPLNPVLLATTALLERPAEPDEVRPTLEMIRQNVNLQARLIDDLLDVMRIVRGKMPLHWEVVDCHRLIHQATQICHSEVLGGDLRLELDLAAGRHHLNADPARWQQVLWNLIKNAVKFTPRGGTITIRTRNGGGRDGRDERLVVEVSDTGIGIGPGVLPRIFDAFQQGETTITRKFGGLGLGLAISRGIVEGHGGTVVAESRGEGQGTTFRVEVPALPGAVPEGNGRATVRDAAAAPAAARRILVVEDEPATLKLMARLLKGLGHEVTTADTISAAWERVRAGDYDLIVSDIGLPDGTGLDLMRKVVALRGRVPAIALTGYGMEDDIHRSHEAGFTEHMTKPIDFTKLEAMIRQVTSGGGGDGPHPPRVDDGAG